MIQSRKEKIAMNFVRIILFLILINKSLGLICYYCAFVPKLYCEIGVKLPNMICEVPIYDRNMSMQPICFSAFSQSE